MNNKQWCEVHQQFHWHLYVCETYSQELKDEIIRKWNKFRENLMDNNYIERMIEKWVPKEAIAIMKIFSWIK
jgi:hypothetical protein